MKKNFKFMEHTRTNKLYFCFKILFSIIFSITIILDSAIVFNGDINSKLEQTHFNSIGFSNVLIGVIVFFIVNLCFLLLEIFLKKVDISIYNKKNTPKHEFRFFMIIFTILILFWMPYFLSYFPGGVFADTIAAINQATGAVGITNHNPILYTLIIKAFLKIGVLFGNPLYGLRLFTIAQEIIMALVLTYFIYKLYKDNINYKVIAIVTLYFGLFELVPLYAVSLWKDVPFSLALFMFIIYIWDIAKNNGEKLKEYKHTLYYCLISLLVMFFRNNGKYIIFLVTIFIIFLYRKNIMKNAKKFIIFSFATIFLTFLVQGPIYNKFNLNGPFNENLGILDQQICYVVYTDGNITDEQKEFINKIIPIESIKEHYTPLNIDNIKWGNTHFSEKFIEENKGQYFKVWFEVFLQNPKKYIIAYLYNTLGYWDVNKAIFYGYTQETMWPGLEEKDIGYVQYDFIYNITGKSVREILKPNIAISSAVFFVITIVLMIMTVYKKNYKYIVLFIPSLLTYLSILIAVPLAFTLRYIYILVLTIPLYFIAPFIKEPTKYKCIEESQNLKGKISNEKA